VSASSRRRSREAALQVLYSVDVKGRSGGPSIDPEEAFERAAAHFELPEGARAFAKQLCCGVADRRDEIDRQLTSHSDHWRLERMAAVDRNVLRLAAYEILHTETPPSIAIDEAVELARRFGAERSPAFVNGVLDSLAREAST
jgi:N utilization substance protein B